TRVAPDLRRPIARFAWPGALEPVLLAACREDGTPTAILRGPSGEYARRVLVRTFAPCVDWNRLRRLVLAQLRLDPLVVSLTQRTFEGEYATTDGFNWVGRHVRELALVATEHPRLLRFLNLVAGCGESPVKVFEREM